MALPLVGLALSGCAMGRWATPTPLVSPGSAIFFAVSQRELSGTQHSWKSGGQVPTIEVTETRFKAIDIRTCRVLRTISIPGYLHVLAWDTDGDDIWFTGSPHDDLTLEPVVVRSLGGGAVTLPIGEPISVEGSSKRPLRAFRDNAKGLLHLWDVHARAVTSILQSPGSLSVLADDRRAVVVRPSETNDAATLVVIPRAPLLDIAKASQIRIAVAGLSAQSGWLFDDAIALRAGSELVTFDLHTGARVRAFPISAEAPLRINLGEHPTIVGLRPTQGDDRSCYGSLELQDVATGTRRQWPLPRCVRDIIWTADDATTIALTGSDQSKEPANWVLSTDTQGPVVSLGRLIDRHVEVSGSSVFFVEGQFGSRPLMIADVTTGSRRAATAPLDAVVDFRADPASRSVIIKTASRLLAYKFATAELRACDGD